MKYILIYLLLASTSLIFSMNGNKIFKEKNCSSCHDPVKDQIKRGLGPSIAQIKEKYSSVEEIVKFLGMQAEPRVYPNRYELMKQQLLNLKLTDSEKNALAHFLLQDKK